MFEDTDFSHLTTLYKERDFTQTTFAEAVGIRQPFLSEVVNNKKMISLPLFYRMAKTLGLRASELMERIETITPADIAMGA